MIYHILWAHLRVVGEGSTKVNNILTYSIVNNNNSSDVSLIKYALTD